MIRGCLRAVADEVLICRFAYPSAFPVPLGIADPAALTLAGWAVARNDGAEPALSGLLIIARDGTGSAEPGSLVLDTHFGPLAITIGAEDLALTGSELSALARGALAARMIGGAGADGLMRVVADALDGLIAAGEADAVGVSLDGGALVIDGTFVPEWIVLRGPDGYRRFGAAETTLRFAGRPSVAVIPDRGWSSDLSAEAAILVGGGTHRIGRLRGGSAP